jgi:AcrR family transcriptional regulator
MSATEETAVRQLRADARRNRERILEAAKQVFGEQGADAQMDDVARRAGVGVGTVYRHFPNKDVLMGELVTDKFRSFAEQAREALAEEDAWEGLSKLLYSTGEHMAENVALQDALRTTSAAFEYAEPARLEMDAVIDKLVKRAQRQGSLRKDFKPEELGMLIGGL